MSLELNETNFASEIENFGGPALVDFWAPWCGPCRSMGPVLDAIATQFAGRLKVAKVNVDDNPALAQKFNVMSIPLLVFFAAGKVVHTHVGSTSQADLARQIETHLVK